MHRAALLVVLVACGGEDDVHHLPDAPPPCVPAASTLSIVAPTTYACHEPFKSKVSITNNACETLTVSAVKLTPMVTAGPCGPPGVGNYMPMTMALQPGETAVLVDLTTGPFCCTSPGCPPTLQCDESFTFDVTTSKGVLSGVTNAHLSLDGCSEVCP